MLLICALIEIASASMSNPQGGSNNRQVSESASPPSADIMAKTSMQGENLQLKAEKVADINWQSASSKAKGGKHTTKTDFRSRVEDSSSKTSRDEDVKTSASGNTNKQQGTWLTH